MISYSPQLSTVVIGETVAFLQDLSVCRTLNGSFFLHCTILSKHQAGVSENPRWSAVIEIFRLAHLAPTIMPWLKSLGSHFSPLMALVKVTWSCWPIILGIMLMEYQIWFQVYVIDNSLWQITLVNIYTGGK